jgi:N-acetylneuraminate synthase
MKTNQSQFEVKIGSHFVGASHRPFIIAELSGNHDGSLETALQMVEMAARSGAQALKLQTYTADTLTIDHDKDDFWISDESSLWKGESLYKLYQKAYTPWDWHAPIFKKCRELGMVYFSTPFDDSAVELLEKLEVPCYKIASFENVHLPLIKRVARTKKPMIISTGMAKVSEIEDAVEAARSAGAKDIVLLKCTSSYPADPKESNLLTIPHMSKMFQVPVGLSDHTLGIGAAVAAVALGACAIEKHIVGDRKGGGVDAAFSMEPQELKMLVEESERAWQAVGSVSYGPGANEQRSIQFRRSIYVVEDIKAGQAFNEQNIRIIRPGHGLAPKYFDKVLGKHAGRDLKRGARLTWEDLS